MIFHKVTFLSSRPRPCTLFTRDPRDTLESVDQKLKNADGRDVAQKKITPVHSFLNRDAPIFYPFVNL